MEQKKNYLKISQGWIESHLWETELTKNVWTMWPKHTTSDFRIFTSSEGSTSVTSSSSVLAVVSAERRTCTATMGADWADVVTRDDTSLESGTIIGREFFPCKEAGTIFIWSGGGGVAVMDTGRPIMVLPSRGLACKGGGAGAICWSLGGGGAFCICCNGGGWREAPDKTNVGCKARTPPGNTVTTCPPACNICFGIMILVIVWVGTTAGAGAVALLAPVRERVVISGTSRMMLEAQMLVMVFSSRLLAGRMAWWLAGGIAACGMLTTGGGDAGAVSISSAAGCGEDRLNRRAGVNESPKQQSSDFSTQNSMISPVRVGWLHKLPAPSNTPFWQLVFFSCTPNWYKTNNTRKCL